MRDPADKLTPASPDDLAAALAFALLFERRKRKHDADIYGGPRSEAARALSGAGGVCGHGETAARRRSGARARF